MDIRNLRTPALVLDIDVYEKNAEIMKSFLTGSKMKLRPHYKSHKCTAIAHRQIGAGAKGICCAKLGEAEDLANAGIEDILIANQITERNKVAQVAHLAKCCYLTVCVDSKENIADLDAAAAFEGSRIHCLVEYEIGMERCGVSTEDEFYALARQIEGCPHLIFEGVQAYAGHLSHEADYDKRKAESEKVEKRLWQLLGYMEEKGLTVREVSGVSTGTIQFRPKDTVYTEAQSGSYIFMDAAYGALNLKFENSLFVLSTVMSRNENYVSADAGRKSVSVDQAMPVIRDCPDVPVDVSEEHITVAAKKYPAVVGDRIFIIPGHCCTTVNLHDFIYFISGDKVIDRVPITSRGKSF